MKLLLFLQPMRSLPLWGRVSVGAADNSSADLGFCRVVVQVMVWKEVYCKQPLRRQAARINKVWDNNGNGNKIMQMLCDEMAFLGAKRTIKFLEDEVKAMEKALWQYIKDNRELSDNAPSGWISLSAGLTRWHWRRLPSLALKSGRCVAQPRRYRY